MTDRICHQCEDENPAWWSPSSLWNRVIGTAHNPRGEGVILCPTCFCGRVEDWYETRLSQR